MSNISDFETAERVFVDHVLVPTGIDVDTNPGYQGARDLAMGVFSKVDPIREKFIEACLGTPYANMPSQALSFPHRFLKGGYEATQMDGLRELVEQSFNLGLLYHLFNMTFPSRSEFDRVDTNNLFSSWAADSLAADFLSKDYDAAHNQLPSTLQEAFYHVKIEPYLKSNFSLGRWKQSKAKSWFRNPFFAGIRLGMALDLATKDVEGVEAGTDDYDYVRDDDYDDEDDDDSFEANGIDVSDDENTQSLTLIDELLAMSNISNDLRAELNSYRADIAEDRFDAGDRQYIRSVHRRVSKRP